MTEPETILDDSGREANKDLNFRLWSKSKHAGYLTPMKLANVLFAMVVNCLPSNDFIKKLKVLDPTCGTGRLLYPFKRQGAKVLGIELDKEISSKAKQLLGGESVRTGSILDYAKHLKGDFDIAVTNPPFGILWNQEETDFEFEDGLSYAKNIESQNATIQICKAALNYHGYLFAIIPTSSFTNTKDAGLRQYLYKNFKVLFRVTINGLFKDEYKIDVQVDLVVCRVNRYDHHCSSGFREIEIDANDPLLEKKILDAWSTVKGEGFDRFALSDSEIDVPYLDNLVEINTINNVEITARGVRGDPTALAMMDFYNDTLDFYNPVVGRPTGLTEAYLESPALCKRGVDRAGQVLKQLGFDLTISDATRKKIEVLKEKFKLLSIPLYPPKDHQLLAYFDEREYIARADVYDEVEEGKYRQDHRDNGKNGKNGKQFLLFKKGKQYLIRPSWVRQSEVTGINVIGEGNQQKTITTSIDRGFLSIEAETELGNRAFREPEPLEVALFLEAFHLPEVRDISEEKPELVKQWKDKIIKKYPALSGDFDYQAEDLARVLTKTKSAYIGYDMGGGKTLCSFVFNAIRNVKRVLVICQSSLVDNWINEANKFGFRTVRLTTHHAIDLLQQSIKRGDTREGTNFYITSYEFLSLDTGRVYDPWSCIKYDQDGNIKHEVHGNTSRVCQGCSTEYASTQKVCPKCKVKEEWTGENCTKCGYSAYKYSSKESIKQYPAYKRIKKLFRSVIIDEVQQAKSKTSFRGQAVRSIHAKSRLELTGTLMKGYITDTFFNIGYITRHNNPLFPYRFDRRGSKIFAEEFSTFKFKDIEFETTLHKGRKKELPEVSNLNRFWKILSSFTIRRLKDEMIKLPEKHRRILALPPDPGHVTEYGIAVEKAEEMIDRELRKPETEVNMGVISKALWSMRFAATIPRIAPEANVKVRKAIEIVEEARAKGEKVLVYSALRDMQATLHKSFENRGINHIFVPSTMQTKDRFKNIKRFQEDPNITAIVAGLNVLNRGFTINAANHVIFTDVEYSPESTDQAEDRAHRTGQEKPVTCYYLLLDWTPEEQNIDFKMYNLITQKKRAISNAIDGRVRFGRTANVLRAGGDYLAIAKAMTGKEEDPVEFEYEKGEAAITEPEPKLSPVVVKTESNGKWNTLYHEVNRNHNHEAKKDEKQMELFFCQETIQTVERR